ncbi:uncharacterized mitochondrial protein AtMg00810-like [Rutidosis leptorrhynchoides]|uniref:uncharacterized mitochondrial protein AtMg00810-like n=1 Tax=Rutidosis leptorrhynchoides TaxID=125765 RepID=UPI003A997486
MNLEIDALNRNNTWIITELSPDRKPVGSKWVYRIKYKSNGEIERYNARLVARVLVKRKIYMTLPKGYYTDSENENKVCKLTKSLYGLKQAPRQWNAKLNAALLEHGFVQSKSDYSLYTKSVDGLFIGLLVYVDDIVVTGNNFAEIEKFKSFLKTKFLIKDLGLLKYFLGIEVLNCNNGVCLSQRKYYLELLNDYGLLGCKPFGTPIESNICVNCESSEKDKFLTNITEYQKLVGRLIYLTLTRPDISFVVHILSQYMHAPLQSHMNLAFRTLRYLKGSPGKGIQLVKGNETSLYAYSDSDWGKCKLNRKSVTGYLIFFCNSLVSWKSKKQSTVSRSSAEAEYRALASTTCEIIWIKNLLLDFNIKVNLPVQLFCDNSSAIQISHNPVFHEKTKHFDIDLHYVRDKQSVGGLSVAVMDKGFVAVADKVPVNFKSASQGVTR